MVKLERKRDTYFNWKYAYYLILIPIGFYLLSYKEAISSVQQIVLIAIMILLAVVGVFGITGRYQPVKVYGYLYLISGFLFAYMALVFIW
ncbi:hypothetical protein Q7A53_00005 [Halobacillus rhizosphaerae]|uniref:hypothetical protein n=1 Tax=Halobacillus rhizosphaerae TaxID=3064889 RepID=UPI00398A6F2F